MADSTIALLRKIRPYVERHVTMGGASQKTIDVLAELDAHLASVPQTFSEFIRNASPEEKAQVYEEVMAKASERMKASVPDTKERNIKLLVDRFLGWPLPKSFSPDCGISFKALNHSWPVGTNLFTADEARQMLEYLFAPEDAFVCPPAPMPKVPEYLDALRRQIEITCDAAGLDPNEWLTGSVPDRDAVSDKDLCIAVLNRCVERLGAPFMAGLFDPQFTTPWSARFDALLKPAPDDLFTEARAAIAAAQQETPK